MAETDLLGNNSITRLKSFVERIERLDEERTGINADIAEIYSEVKGCGLDKKTVRALVRRRKMDTFDRDEQDELLDIYERALSK